MKNKCKFSVTVTVYTQKQLTYDSVLLWAVINYKFSTTNCLKIFGTNKNK